MPNAAMSSGGSQAYHIEQRAATDCDDVTVSVDVVHLDFRMDFRDVKIGVFRALTALELHGVADESQAVVVSLEVRQNKIDQVGLGAT